VLGAEACWGVAQTHADANGALVLREGLDVSRAFAINVVRPPFNWVSETG
jgi:hypothetical protein